MLHSLVLGFYRSTSTDLNSGFKDCKPSTLLYFFVLFSLGFCNSSIAQNSLEPVFLDSIPSLNFNDTLQNQEILIVNDIQIRGNKRTKKHIILRELDFTYNDTISRENLEQVLEDSRNQVYNSGLFNEVSIKISGWKNQFIDFRIEVEERWYIYPVPIFELTDRSFNVWWNGVDGGKKRDFSRTEYGFSFAHQNFRGRKEELTATVQFGFTKKFELSYSIPFIDKQRKLGVNPFISYILNSQVPVRNVDNRSQPYEHENGYARRRFRIGMASTYRPNIHNWHYTNLSYFENRIVDTLAMMNPDYFLDGRTKQQYIYLTYQFTRDNRDISAYPLKGNYFRVQMTKAGLGLFKDINMAWVILNYTHYFKLNERWYFAANARTRLSFPKRQPFFNQQGMGFGSDYVRGYEYYIIDGQSFGLTRAGLRFKVLDIKFKNPLLKVDQFKTIPFAIFLKTYAETGFVSDDYYFETNPLANKWLAGTGFGIDLVTAYDMVFSFEYSVNRRKEWNFFLAFAVNYDFQ